MRIPGFTAEASVSDLSTSNRTYQVRTGLPLQQVPRLSQAVTPQFFGGHSCYWACYPGSGCEYICHDFPY